MSTDGLTRLRVGRVPALAQWSEGSIVTVPGTVLEGLGADAEARARGELLVEQTPDGLHHLAGTLRTARAFTQRPPASARSPISYRVVPGWARSAIGAMIGRRQRRRPHEWASFPQWPLDLSADVIADLTGAARPMYPDARTPVLLSHDIDSPEGLRNLVEHFLPLEEHAGARSSNYVVPHAYPIDHGLLTDVHARGHEIGIHGFDHSNRTPFAAPEERRRRLDGARELAERYNAIGYRAPSLLRTRELLRDLQGRYRYDSSIPTSGGLFPVPNNGCASARPFVIEGMTEIPITMPRDGSLRFLGHSPREIAELWMTCAGRIARSGGIVVLLTHCERRFSGNRPMLDAYRRFIDFVSERSETFRWTLPVELL